MPTDSDANPPAGPRFRPEVKLLHAGLSAASAQLLEFSERNPETEERLLLEQFGEVYRAYMRRTKRLVPFVV